MQPEFQNLDKAKMAEIPKAVSHLKAFLHWQTFLQMEYHIEEEPCVFINRFRCQKEAVESEYPTDCSLDAERIIKKKLLEGLPTFIRGNLVDFVGDEIPFTEFIDMV